MLLLSSNDDLRVVTRRTEDGYNDGSLVCLPRVGHGYCIAKAPRYATDKEWLHNANRIIKALQNYKEDGQ